MHGEVAFKRGSDLTGSVVPHGMRSITCENCGARTESDAAKEQGWQLRPPVCPDCLRWTTVDVVADQDSAIRIEKRGRHWAVLEDGQLLCLTVYRRGARAVASRLADSSGVNGDGRR